MSGKRAPHELDEDEHVEHDDLADVVRPVYQQLFLHFNFILCRIKLKVMGVPGHGDRAISSQCQAHS